MGSSSRARITSQSGELGRIISLLRELGLLSGRPREWTVPVALPGDEDNGHTPWRLAERFLIVYLEFKQAVEGWRSFHGGGHVPDGWTLVLGEATDAAGRLLDDQGFQPTLLDHVFRDHVTGKGGSPDASEDIFWGAVGVERAVLLGKFFQPSTSDVDSSLPSQGEGGSGGSSLAGAYLDWARRRRGELLEKYLGQGSLAYRDALWHVEERRKAMLRVKGLIKGFVPPDFELNDNQEDMMYSEWIDRAARRLDFNPSMMEPINEVLKRIGGLGYGKFFDEVLDGIHLGGGDSSVKVNVIPGEGSGGDCAPLLMAFARKRTGSNNLQKTLNKVNDHLIRCCSDTGTRFVVVFTDHWDADDFKKNFSSTLSEWKRSRGVSFLFVGVGYPDHVLSPLGVQL